MTTANSTSKVWFITGASRGFGQIWATAALARGDKVAATSRDVASLEPLVKQFGDSILPITLDVTDRNATFAAVTAAKEKFGRLDVVLSNAGYGHQGAVEEITEAEARAQIDTNLFGTLWLAQAAMAIFREQKSGHLLAVSSVLGVFSVPTFGIYSASKFAVEGLFEALAQESIAFGVNVTLIEPAGYSTDFNNPSSAKISQANPAYEHIRDLLADMFKNAAFGDPQATAEAILQVVDSAAPPRRIALGKEAVNQMTVVYQTRMAIWEAWREVSIAAHGN